MTNLFPNISLTRQYLYFFVGSGILRLLFVGLETILSTEQRGVVYWWDIYLGGMEYFIEGNCGVWIQLISP